MKKMYTNIGFVTELNIERPKGELETESRKLTQHRSISRETQIRWTPNNSKNLDVQLLKVV